VLFQGREERFVTFLPTFPEDPVEISHRLVIVNGKEQIDRFHSFFRIQTR
jgi:hypothetical protein